MFLYFVRGLRFGVGTMNFYGRRFNLYLLLAVTLALVSGCAAFKKKAPQTAALHIHIESDASQSKASRSISLLRSEPVVVNVVTEPILTEEDITSAKLMAAPGGFVVELQFDETGSWTLEQFSASSPGKHLVIYGQWGDKLANGRWLAAPSINRRMAGGTLTFTPDASREETEQLVNGLNAYAKQVAAEKSK
jgi:preprotein translocase subunit SecD